MDVGKVLNGVLATIALLMAVPGSAQTFSDTYNFLKAVKERDGTKVSSLLSEKGTTVVNAKERGTGDGGLHMMARARDLTWLTYLLSKGARVDLQNQEGMTALGVAAQIGWLDGAQVLLARKASVDLPNSRGETPLILAVQRRDLAMVRVLLASGANPKRTDSVAGMSAIDYARQDARSASVLKLLEAKPAVPPKAVAGPKL
jgi:ankyrin repeat protein